ncbi:hypothetical protein PPTG_21667 [Phytophthora nicotianae INRA-310]|uniref:Uncharacterized protein n=2 Tax=Phytophthora nicotianae TaxID=4792 RepID=W2QWT6_PHYN3|nr:hypothetical protein PPTG_21667 [Phytophthora nicotianae INRA-310]ETN17603.1 hypothetical protein PPTG_21667 [Phytophthora nicotianae INRA-310]ETO63073.1 hypothetical protein F444_19216 [Phytophthora nicotianae P1976]
MPHTAESTPSVFAADFDSSPPFVGWVASKPSPAENLPSVSLYFQAYKSKKEPSQYSCQVMSQCQNTDAPANPRTF